MSEGKPEKSTEEVMEQLQKDYDDARLENWSLPIVAGEQSQEELLDEETQQALDELMEND